MTNLMHVTLLSDLPTLLDKITRNSIGMDEYFDRLFNLHETTNNYPPYNSSSGKYCGVSFRDCPCWI
jgi:molecular chaperone IbpA